MAKCINNIVKNLPLAERTTLKIGGNAEMAFFPSSKEELCEVRDYLISHNKKITVIGAGSNLLVSSKGISGGVIFTENFKNIEINNGVVKVDCGLRSSVFAKILLENKLTGLEFLIGIPGTIGGAVTMNSSAHGQAIEDTIESAEVMDIETGEIHTLNKSELKLGYRNSFVVKNKHYIINAVFRLKEGNPDEISDKMNFHVEYRRQNHPPVQTEPNAGSTFRNPEQGVYIGKLLHYLGAKDWVEGGARISHKHANFLHNTGNATSLDISRLMHRMHSSVKEKYGYDIIAEIRYVGDPTNEEEIIWKNFIVH